MSLNAQDIRTLRQRLGWSVAEMARRMGCSTDLVTKWESGALVPEPESLNQLRYLRDHADGNSERTLQKPVAEVRMEAGRLSQLTHRDLLKDS
ncbi:MAG: helix-turn-helix domain-containing protein [Bdellovibrionales bacterium]|nr:helix-turn-helix domain-containing protein [Bdellovibrionales bacterium]